MHRSDRCPPRLHRGPHISTSQELRLPLPQSSAHPPAIRSPGILLSAPQKSPSSASSPREQERPRSPRHSPHPVRSKLLSPSQSGSPSRPPRLQGHSRPC